MRHVIFWAYSASAHVRDAVRGAWKATRDDITLVSNRLNNSVLCEAVRLRQHA